MAGMIKKLIASGVAAKVLQEARKPENQAKLKKMLADFQNKQKGGGGRTPGARQRTVGMCVVVASGLTPGRGRDDRRARGCRRTVNAEDRRRIADGEPLPSGALQLR